MRGAIRSTKLEANLREIVRSAVKQGEAIGTLGKSKPSSREMFEDVYKEPDWRILDQRRELGV